MKVYTAHDTAYQSTLENAKLIYGNVKCWSNDQFKRLANSYFVSLSTTMMMMMMQIEQESPLECNFAHIHMATMLLLLLLCKGKLNFLHEIHPVKYVLCAQKRVNKQ